MYIYRENVGCLCCRTDNSIQSFQSFFSSRHAQKWANHFLFLQNKCESCGINLCGDFMTRNKTWASTESPAAENHRTKVVNSLIHYVWKCVMAAATTISMPMLELITLMIFFSLHSYCWYPQWTPGGCSLPSLPVRWVASSPEDHRARRTAAADGLLSARVWQRKHKKKRRKMKMNDDDDDDIVTLSKSGLFPVGREYFYILNWGFRCK